MTPVPAKACLDALRPRTAGGGTLEESPMRGRRESLAGSGSRVCRHGVFAAKAQARLGIPLPCPMRASSRVDAPTGHRRRQFPGQRARALGLPKR